MDFKDQIKQLSERVLKLKEQILTEEATKNALIMPFIQALGYDVFNPTELVPEYTADIGTKKGEKVDYAILKDGNPIILIECKWWGENLDLHSTQLLRYFNVTKAKFGILTNGIVYRFFTDLEKPNLMDEKPFLEFNFLDIKESLIEELKKFHKSYFDINSIVNTASELKYSNEIKTIMINELKNPTEQFVKFFVGLVYTGRATTGVMTQFTELVKKSLNHLINDMINDRLKSALDQNTVVQIQEQPQQPEQNNQKNEPKIVTTAEELDAYYIVKSIARQKVESSRIILRDNQTYCGILLDDNNRKPICRLYFNASKKYIVLFDAEKNEIKIEINKIDDIFNHSEQILKAIDVYEAKPNENK